MVIQLWSKATKEQRKKIVVEEVTRMELEHYYIKAIHQGQQGAWTRWETITTRAMSWADI